MSLIIYLVNHINKFIIFNHFLLIEPNINIISIELGFGAHLTLISVFFVRVLIRKLINAIKFTVSCKESPQITIKH